MNHWAAEPMVTRDVDFVVAVDEVDRAVAALEAVGFMPERRTSKAIKDLGDIARLVEAHPGLRETLPEDVARGLAGTR